jgi:transglutaminase-like putative cysteine protease
MGWTALAAACLLFAPGISAAPLPGWADRVAATAPDVESVAVGDSIYMLLSEEHVGVQPDGTFRMRQRYATQVLSSHQRHLSYQFPFSKDARIESARAWHLPPGDAGHRAMTPVEVDVQASASAGQPVRTVQMDGLRRGSIVFIEFETSIRPSLLTLSKRFFEDAPVREARLELVTPPGWTVRHTWVRHSGPEPATEGQTRVWTVRDLPAPSQEPLAERASMKAPQLAVNMIPPAGARVSTPAVPDWKTFSAWYDDLARGADAVTPEVEDLAARVLPAGTAAAGVDELGRIREAARWVRDNVHYVPPRRGAGVSLLPRPAARTLASGFGDCKDMGTLLRALLAARGIRSYPLLVHASEGDTLSDDVPAWGFDHYVVAVPLPARARIPAHFAGAIVDGGDLGPMLVIDTTHTDLSVGSLSSALAGKRALLVAGDRGRLLTLPASDASAHRIERRVVAERGLDRSLRIRIISRLVGQPAVLARGAYRASAAGRRVEAERDALEGWPGAAVTGYSARVETDDGAYEETVTLAAAPESAPVLRARLFAGASSVLPRVALERRHEAVVYDYPRSVRYEVSLHGTPNQPVEPGSWEQHAAGWSMSRKVEREGTDAVHATWDVTLTRTRFEPESFRDLDAFYAAAVTTTSAELSF